VQQGQHGQREDDQERQRQAEHEQRAQPPPAAGGPVADRRHRRQYQPHDRARVGGQRCRRRRLLVRLGWDRGHELGGPARDRVGLHQQGGVQDDVDQRGQQVEAQDRQADIEDRQVVEAAEQQVAVRRRRRGHREVQAGRDEGEQARA
jgi:hypothetical protein